MLASTGGGGAVATPAPFTAGGASLQQAAQAKLSSPVVAPSINHLLDPVAAPSVNTALATALARPVVAPSVKQQVGLTSIKYSKTPTAPAPTAKSGYNRVWNGYQWTYQPNGLSSAAAKSVATTAPAPATSSGGGTSSAAPAASGGSSGGSATATASPDFTQQAALATDMQLNPQLDALKAQLAQQLNDSIKAKNDATGQAARAQSDLAAIFDRLNGYLQDRQAVGQQQFQQLGQDTQANSQDLLTKLAGIASGAQQGVNSEYQRLGISGNTGKLNSDAALLQSLAANNAAQNQQHASDLGANWQGLAAQLAASSQASGASHEANTASELQKALDQIAFNQMQNSNTTNSKLASVEASRGPLQYQTQQQLADQAYQHQMDAAQQAFTNAITQSKFNLGAGQFDWQKQMDQANLALAAQQAQAKAASSKNTLPNQGIYPAGIGGAQQFLSTVQDSSLQHALLAAVREMDTRGAFTDSVNTKPVDPNNPKNIGAVTDAGWRWLAHYYPQYNNATVKGQLADAFKVYYGSLNS